MGLFGFACARCWDYDCDCTQEELDQYKEDSKRRFDGKDGGLKEIIMTDSYPHASVGDIIMKGGKEWYLKAIIDGRGVVDRIIPNADEFEHDVELKPPYYISKSILL